MEASCTPVESPVKVELLTGRAVWGSDEILLSEQNWVFICALARCYHPASREQLEAILWPDATREQAENLFSVGLHRLRRRLGAGVVIQSADGYRLGDNVVVDLWEIEALSNAHELPDAETQTVERWLAIYRRIACGCTRSSGKYEFVASLERRLLNAARSVTERLADVALRHGDAAVALELAQLARKGDACDERACEIVIRCQLAFGNRAAAIREYREYARALADELELEPSFTLRSLLDSSVA